MKEKKKVGGLERFYIACFQPSRYKELLDEKTGYHVLYVIGIVFLLVIIETVIPFFAWDLSVGGMESLILERLPAFTVENGKMTIAQPVEFDLSGILHVKADSGVDQYQKKDFDDRYQEELLFSGSNLMMKMGDRVMDISMSDISQEKVDNQALVRLIPWFRILLMVYFFSSYLAKAAEYMVAALFFALICRAAIRTPDGKYVNLKGTIVIAIYAKTLFTLIRSVNTCLGKPFNETLVLIMGTFGTVLFIDRAEAAVLNISRHFKR